MKIDRPGARWTVDWAGIPVTGPRVGHIVHRFTATHQDAGYYRVTAVREIQPRKPLEPPHTARYAVSAEYLGEERRHSDWQLYAFPRNRKNPEQTRRKPDRFSPLL